MNRFAVLWVFATLFGVVTDELWAQTQQQVSTKLSPPQKEPWLSYEEMHEENVSNFIRRPGMGFSRLVTVIETAEKDEKNLLDSAMSRRVVIGRRQYAIKNIELVGTSKHNPPIVFSNPIVHSVYGQPATEAPKESTSTPTAQKRSAAQQATSTLAPQSSEPVPETKRFQYRDLSEYELEVISALNKGGEISVQTVGNDRIVIAPIRAKEDCLRCHEGSKTGDVLGAFRYHLSPLE